MRVIPLALSLLAGCSEQEYGLSPVDETYFEGGSGGFEEGNLGVSAASTYSVQSLFRTCVALNETVCAYNKEEENLDSSCVQNVANNRGELLQKQDEMITGMTAPFGGVTVYVQYVQNIPSDYYAEGGPYPGISHEVDMAIAAGDGRTEISNWYEEGKNNFYLPDFPVDMIHCRTRWVEYDQVYSSVAFLNAYRLAEEAEPQFAIETFSARFPDSQKIEVDTERYLNDETHFIDSAQMMIEDASDDFMILSEDLLGVEEQEDYHRYAAMFYYTDE